MIIIIRTSLLLLLLVFSQSGFAQSSNAAPVLDRLIRAYGGETNLRKLDSQIQEWDLVALVGNRQGTDVRSVRVPDQLRVTLTYPSKTEIRILNGDTGHVIFSGAPAQDVSGPQRDAMRLQLMRLYSPLALRDKIDSVSLTEDGEFSALSLVEQGVRVDYLVNKEQWRIEKVTGTLTMNGIEMQFLTQYSDFAVVEGVLVHRRENKFAGGVNTAMLELRQITFNAEFSDSHFKP